MVLGNAQPGIDDGECRCPCGRLLARRDDGRVSVRCPRCKRTCALDGDAPDETRCECGRLIARRAQDDLELRCPRCKRFVDVTIG